MPRSDDFDNQDQDDLDLDIFEPGEESPELEDEHLRVFSIDDDDEDLDQETADANPDKPLLDEVLSDLEAGHRYYADLYGFSDLSAPELAMMASRWPLIAPELRATVVHEAFDIGQENLKFEFTRFFLFATGDSDAQVRQHAVAALGLEAEPVAAERLLDVLRDDDSDDVRMEAATSLGPYVVLAEWEELSSDLRQRLWDQLFRVAEDEDESWHLRRRAAESVAAFGPHERVNRIVQRMYDEDEMGLRASALLAAGRGNQRAWLPVVIEEFENEDAEIRFEAARSAGMFGDVDALPGLSELARNDEDVDVRHGSIAAIGEICGSGAIRILSRLVELAPASDQEVIDDALIEASLESDPLSLGVDPAIE